MRCSYRLRWFKSKGAYLVLLWTLLIIVEPWSLYELLVVLTNNESAISVHLKWLLSLPILAICVSAPLSGWLADAKFGNYKVFKAGAVLMFISMVINCFILVLEALIWENNQKLTWIFLSLPTSLFTVGACACTVTALPLGLDQMPDASSSNIASYINWFVCIVFLGLLFGYDGRLVVNYFDKKNPQISMVWALILTACMTVVLCSLFLCKPKWLIIEPKSPQSLKTIFQVLKFAAKHKAPLNRSALTYWEEDIPSRIDLGKTKYGGPFTTEQVEDVKTILRLLIIPLPLLFLLTSYSIPPGVSTPKPSSWTQQEFNTFHLVMNPALFSVIGALLHEFLLYPFFGHRFPSILKSIGIASLVYTLARFTILLIAIVCHFTSSEMTTSWTIQFSHKVTSGLFGQVLITSLFEFLCAQSPYNMRGLLLSFIIPLVLLCNEINSKVVYNHICANGLCGIIFSALRCFLCLVGLLLFYVVARWYKKRVRDEDYSTQRVVEEVYDRYLTAAAAHSSSYGTII